MKKKRKRYRYIISGICSVSDPITEFKLFAANQIFWSECIRVEIPEDIKAEPSSFFGLYFENHNNVKVGDLNPKVIYQGRSKWIVDEKLTKLWKQGDIKPCDFWEYIEKREEDKKLRKERGRKWEV